MSKKPYDVDAQVKIEAIENAQKIVNDIISAYHDPSKSVYGDSLKAYQELQEWGWFDTNPISVADNKSMYIKIIAMNQYKILKAQKETSGNKARSKWEVVMGKARR